MDHQGDFDQGVNQDLVLNLNQEVDQYQFPLHVGQDLDQGQVLEDLDLVLEDLDLGLDVRGPVQQHQSVLVLVQ